jgi:hypothetical protein
MSTSKTPAFNTSSPWRTVPACIFLGAAASVLFQKTLGTCGDYPQHFQALYIGIAVGAIAGSLLTVLLKKTSYGSLVYPMALTLIRYFLASILMSYGIVKIFATQFPHMMANMDARFIELNPMRVAWTFFGYSRGYQMFLGWGEFIPGILLLFRRTWLLGAIFAAVVMLNVFVINIFFEVCLKLNSGLYLILALFLIGQRIIPLWRFFILNKKARNKNFQSLENPNWLRRGITFANIIFIAGLLIWGGNKCYETYQYANRISSVPVVQGAWKTGAFHRWEKDRWIPLTSRDSLFAQKIFFEGSLGVIKNDFIRDRFILEVDEFKKMLTLTFRTSNNEFLPPVRWQFDLPATDSLVLLGKWRGDSIRVQCLRNKEKLSRY